MDELATIDRAATVVGTGRDGDYVLAPSKHADELGPNAPSLARLLRGGRMEGLARQYERLDAEAIEAQRKFKNAMLLANIAVLATSALSAAMLAVGLVSSFLGAGERALLVGLGLFALLAGAFASMWLFRVREGSLLETWMTARAAAETVRIAYFSQLMQIRNGDPSDPPLNLLKLEYFRRYQLDVQIAYYRTRRMQHRDSAEQTLVLGGIAVALASVASGAAAILGAFDTRWVSLAALSVVGTSLTAFAATREATNQDRRNAERYGRTLTALESLRDRLGDVRSATLSGSTAASEEFVAAVQEQLSLEHRQWMEGAESTRSAIGKLNEALALAEKDRAKRLPASIPAGAKAVTADRTDNSN